MIERLVLIDEIENIQEKFKAIYNGVYEKRYNIKPGQKSLIITDEKPNTFQLAKFGLTPFYEKNKKNLTEARSEGEYNPNNDPNYKGSKAIILQHEFRKAIRYQRCLILASAFIASNKTRTEAYLVHYEKRPIALAGLWDNWENSENKPETSYAVVTVAATETLQKHGIVRMPVVLRDYEESIWLNAESGLSQITKLLRAYPAEKINGYKINPAILNSEENSKELIKPIEDPFHKNEGQIIPKTSKYWHKKPPGEGKIWRK